MRAGGSRAHDECRDVSPIGRRDRMCRMSGWVERWQKRRRELAEGADADLQCWFSLCWVVGLIFCVGGLIVGTWGKTGIPVAGVTPPKSTAVNEYVDCRLCAGCHSQIYRNYRQTGMAKSLFKPAPANTIEDYKGNTQFYHSLSDTHYSMIFREQAYYQRRWQIGLDGETIPSGQGF